MTDDNPNIDSPFNACMHRGYCNRLRADNERLRGLLRRAVDEVPLWDEGVNAGDLGNEIEAFLAGAADQPAAATDEREEFLDLLGRYWDLAYTEGKEGRTCDTENCDAQRTIDEIMDRYDRRTADNSPATPGTAPPADGPRHVGYYRGRKVVK